jgi:hypothetical protein
MNADVVILPATFTCLRCMENPALPTCLWCAVCAPIVDALPTEPVDGGLEGSIARHPAGKRLEANHPARLLGVAQVAIEVALRTNDLAEVHAQLEVALARIKPEVTA